jgi:hypothetical protein
MRLLTCLALNFFIALPASAAVTSTVNALMTSTREMDGVPFSEVIHAATGKRVVPLDMTNAIDRELIAKIGRALDKVLHNLNAPGGAAQKKRRINEVSTLFEAAMKTELNAVEGFQCDYPRLASGAFQRSGYPDLRSMDRKSGRVIYLDPKLFEQGNRNSSLRTFYYEAKHETNKILDDAHHLAVGFEHDGRPEGIWKFSGWELVDLAHFRVKLKAEFQASNRDLYRPEAIVGTSRTNSTAAAQKQRE